MTNKVVSNNDSPLVPAAATPPSPGYPTLDRIRRTFQVPIFELDRANKPLISSFETTSSLDSSFPPSETVYVVAGSACVNGIMQGAAMRCIKQQGWRTSSLALTGVCLYGLSISVLPFEDEQYLEGATDDS